MHLSAPVQHWLESLLGFIGLEAQTLTYPKFFFLFSFSFLSLCFALLLKVRPQYLLLSLLPSPYNIFALRLLVSTSHWGKGPITQQVHAWYMEGSEAIHPTFTQWVRGVLGLVPLPNKS